MKEQNLTTPENIRWHNLTINRDKLEKMFSEKTSEYDQLIEQIGIFLFSKNWNNNIDQFFNILENDDGEGKWEIIIENARIIENWLNVDVYLVPIGFEID